MRLLVIGSGSIARRHIANLRTLYPQAEIGCMSASGRMLDSAETQATCLFGALADALSWAPLFVVVASPAPFHLDHALPFLRQGIPVLAEKPLTDSLARFEQHAAELSPWTAIFEVSYNLRYLPSTRKMKELIAEKAVGSLRSISIDLGQYLPDWRPQSDYRNNVSARRELGGGALLELSHEFDYLTWIFGKFDQVYGLVSNSGALDIDVEDRADILFSRKDGLVAHVHLDFLQRKATRKCKVVGAEGNLVWDLIANSIWLENGEGVRLLLDGADFDRNRMYLDQLQHIAAISRGEARPLVGLETAAGTMAIIEAIRASAAANAPFSLQGLQ